jgi:hypothetical protein
LQTQKVQAHRHEKRQNRRQFQSYDLRLFGYHQFTMNLNRP